MAAPSERWRVLARAGEIEYDRILFFSDAVFAIALGTIAFMPYPTALLSAGGMTTGMTWPADHDRRWRPRRWRSGRFAQP